MFLALLTGVIGYANAVTSLHMEKEHGSSFERTGNLLMCLQMGIQFRYEANFLFPQPKLWQVPYLAEFNMLRKLVFLLYIVFEQ